MTTSEILYESKDKSINIKLQYIVKSKLKIYNIGKSWPKHTQCLLFYNGILLDYGTVIKHWSDDDNQNYAYKLASKKALKSINLKWLRTELWKLINEKFKE